MQDKLLARIHTLGIKELEPLEALTPLNGDYLNLECALPNGKTGKILDDAKQYLAAQVETETDKCFGVAADETQIAVYRYGCNGAGAELVLWCKLE